MALGFGPCLRRWAACAVGEAAVRSGAALPGQQVASAPSSPDHGRTQLCPRAAACSPAPQPLPPGPSRRPPPWARAPPLQSSPCTPVRSWTRAVREVARVTRTMALCRRPGMWKRRAEPEPCQPRPCSRSKKARGRPGPSQRVQRLSRQSLGPQAGESATDYVADVLCPDRTDVAPPPAMGHSAAKPSALRRSSEGRGVGKALARPPP